MGPMTGRAAGFCAGYQMPGYANPIGGRGGFGRGFGGGRGRGGWGRRNWFYATGVPGWSRAAMGYPAFGGMPPAAGMTYGAPVSREQQLDALKGQAEYFADALDGIRKRIEELEAQAQQD